MGYFLSLPGMDLGRCKPLASVLYHAKRGYQRKARAKGWKAEPSVGEWQSSDNIVRAPGSSHTWCHYLNLAIIWANNSPSVRWGGRDLNIAKENVLLSHIAGEPQNWNNNTDLWTPSSDSFYSYRCEGNKEKMWEIMLQSHNSWWETNEVTGTQRG